MTREEQIKEYANSFKDKGMESDELKDTIRLAIIDGAKWADNNPIKPSLPSNLDEAARLYAIPHYMKDVDVNYLEEYPYDKIAEAAFKAGAEWMAGQGASFNTTVGWIDGPTILDWPDDILDKFEMGDKVIVQIRKK